jgi:opacity protein-like surface antigen
MMKPLTVIAAFGTLIGTPALAADMAVKAPPPAPAPIYSWAGFYLGVNGGGGITSTEFFDPDCFSCADTKFQTPFGTVGGQLGYNWQWASTVLGLEGDLNWASAKDTHSFALDDGNFAGTASFKFDAFGSVRARAGLAFDHTLVYVTAGPAWGHFNSVTTLGNTLVPGNPSPSVRDIATDDSWHWGFAAGAGVEYMLDPHWSLRVEYLFLDFPDVLVNFVPFPPNGSAGDARFRMNYGYAAHLARVGLNYRFGGDTLNPSPFPATVPGKNVFKAPALSAPTASWAGFYLGVNGGGGIASAARLDPDCFTCADTKFKLGFGTIGGQAGYNWQWGSTVLGVVGDLNWASASQSRAFALNRTFGPGPGVGTADFKFDAFGSVRARAGSWST